MLGKSLQINYTKHPHPKKLEKHLSANFIDRIKKQAIPAIR